MPASSEHPSSGPRNGGARQKKKRNKGTPRRRRRRRASERKGEESGDEKDTFGSDVMQSVLKILTTHVWPKYTQPWQMDRPIKSSSSGCVIKYKPPGGDNRDLYVITNAHAVENAIQVRVKKNGGDAKFVAHVVAISNQRDLALLSIKDNKFWRSSGNKGSLKPIPFGRLPKLRERLTAVGYPVGGETVSITSGVVSRIEMSTYSQGGGRGPKNLVIQSDAAINDGNSGGPVLDDDAKLVGVAFESYSSSSEAEGIGYVIPTIVVRGFLEDVSAHIMTAGGNSKSNFNLDGSPGPCFSWQMLENATMRKMLKVKGSGILVKHIPLTSNAAKVLCKGDVVTHLIESGKGRKIPIANDGTVHRRHFGNALRNDQQRILFEFFFSTMRPGQMTKLQIIRGGKVKHVEYSVEQPSKFFLVPVHASQTRPECKLKSIVMLNSYFLHFFCRPYYRRTRISSFDRRLPSRGV